MKTLSLQVEDHLYEALVTLLQQFPQDKVRFVDEPQARFAKMSFEQASDYVLTKNAELYKNWHESITDTRSGDATASTPDRSLAGPEAYAIWPLWNRLYPSHNKSLAMRRYTRTQSTKRRNWVSFSSAIIHSWTATNESVMQSWRLLPC